MNLDTKVCRSVNDLASDKERLICPHLDCGLTSRNRRKVICCKHGNKELGYSHKYKDYLRCPACLANEKAVQKAEVMYE